MNNRHQNTIAGIIGLLLIDIVLRTPESAAASANIPVIKRIDERDNSATCTLCFVIIHCFSHLLDEGLTCRDNPAIHRVIELLKGRF